MAPDLDLIKQAEQGCGWFGEADPAISTFGNQRGYFAADLLQEQQTEWWRLDQWL